MNSILVRDYPNYAGKWIYDGYAAAWRELGYHVERYTNLRDFDTQGKDLMLTSGDVIVRNHDYSSLKEFLLSFRRIYMFVSPNKFPKPWGQHPNFVDQTARNPVLVKELRSLKNIKFWTFCNIPDDIDYWAGWGEVHTVPLAYDSVRYRRILDSKWKYDVAFCGGWANNGFDSKKKIMKRYFSAFKDSGLKCGFFVNKNLSHEQECKLLTNSKVCINIHDDYQRELKLDTNERTWKTLGVNGVLVSDNVGSVIPDIYGAIQTDTPEEMVEAVKEEINSGFDGSPGIRKYINENHTYINRCKQLESLWDL